MAGMSARRTSSREPAVPSLMRRLSLLLLITRAGAQTEEECCATQATPLAFGEWTSSTVQSGQWNDFFVVGQADGESLAFELSAESTSPTALGVYVYDGVTAENDDAPETSRCRLCQTENPQGGVAVQSVNSMHPASGAPTAKANLDMDTVSHIGNSTHRRYYVYVGECYQMLGSVYYVSVYGQTPSAVNFQIKALRVPAQLPITTIAEEKTLAGHVCDGKYMHYFVDWAALHPGGMQAAVQVTSGELQSFYLRKDRCASQLNGPDKNIARVNLLSYGCAHAAARFPPSAPRARRRVSPPFLAAKDPAASLSRSRDPRSLCAGCRAVR